MCELVSIHGVLSVTMKVRGSKFTDKVGRGKCRSTSYDSITSAQSAFLTKEGESN